MSYATNKMYTFTCRKPMGTKVSEVVTNLDRLPPVKSHDLSSGDLKNWKVTSPILKDLWSLNLVVGDFTEEVQNENA